VCGTNLWDESEQTTWVTLAVSKRGARRRLVQRSFVVDVGNEGAESSEVRRARHTKVNFTGESDVQATRRNGLRRRLRIVCDVVKADRGQLTKLTVVCAGVSSASGKNSQARFFFNVLVLVL
jgi:RNase P protein component